MIAVSVVQLKVIFSTNVTQMRRIFKHNWTKLERVDTSNNCQLFISSVQFCFKCSKLNVSFLNKWLGQQVKYQHRSMEIYVLELLNQDSAAVTG
jgi:hypothetical protein